MASTRGFRRFSDGRKHSRFDNPHMQNRNDTFQFTDINPACFSASIPFSLVPNPPKISPSFPTEGDFHLDNRAVKRHCSGQGYSEDEHKYHRYHRERDREHPRERDKGQERDRSDDRTFNRISEKVEHDRDRRKDRDNRDEIPNNTIMVRSLHSSVAEADIRIEVVKYGLEPKDIRLIRDKDTGTSRGFAFVEFSLLSEAVRWKELTKGTIFVDGQHRSTLHYSIPKEAMGAEKVLLNRSDWDCAKCATSNFRRRDYCFKCNSRREDVDVRSAEGCNEISSSPSNTLLFRNLDVLTTEERVLAMLGQLTTLPIKSLRVAKDTLTNTSRGFAFVELHSTSEATQLHDLLLSMNKNFYVDGRQVTVSYAKRSLSSMNSAASANAAVVALAAAQWSNRESESYSSTYGNFADENLKTGDVQTLGSAATVINSPDLGNVGIQGVTYKKYPMPDISTYQYDDSSGYYYDASTGLYYDAVSQYYYSYELQQYMYWDNTQKTYLPASETSTITSTVTTPVLESDVADAENQDMRKNRKEEKLDKVKIAKKIAKDMEKWAKTLNQKKENAKLGITPILSSEPVFVVPTAKNIIKQSAAADAGFAVLERKTLLPEQNNFSSETTASKSLNKSNSTDKKISSLVAQYGDDSDTESEDETTDVEVKKNKKSNEFDESKFLNWDKLACLLCKRQFPTKEVLLKHQQLSDLHKKNRTKLLSAQKN